MTIIKYTYLLGFFLLSLSSYVAADNLIKNGDFNQGGRWQAPPPYWTGNGSSGFTFWKDGSDGDGVVIENGNHFMILNESDTYQDVMIDDKEKRECLLKYREGVHPGATGEVFLQYLDSNKNVLVSKSKAISYPFTYAEGLLSSIKTLMGGETPDNITYVRVKTTGTKAAGYAKIDDIELTCEPKGSTISGYVFKDTNSNDLFDSGESGIANISVWLQFIHADGSIDPVKVLADTDVMGNYHSSSLADGRYQVYVDITDTDLPADHVFSGTNPLVITVTGADVTNADFPFDEVVCSAFSDEVSPSALAAASHLNTDDHIIVPSLSLSPREGHLRAYELEANGIPKTAATWDAATRMTWETRASRLYSSDSAGDKIRFSELTETAFDVPKAHYEDILAYTLDPSYNDGKYLAGRQKDAFLGGISRHNGIALLNNAIDTFQYLGDTDYQAYYTSSVASRDTRVLVDSDDGFLYAFDDKTGDLAWAWMPRTLVKELKDYQGFQQHHFMRGKIDVVDLKAANGYHPYVVGSYKGGLGHYVLQLDKNSTSKSDLKAIVWDSDSSNQFVASPNNGQMEYFSDDQGETYVTYVMTGVNNKSTLFIKSLTTAATQLQIALNFHVTSTPFVMMDFDKHNAPARKTLYLGDDTGNIYAAALLKQEGTLASVVSIAAELNGSNVATLSSDNTDSVRFIGAAISSSDRRYYLRAQSDTRLSVFKYETETPNWKRVWTSYEGGSGKWAEDGTHMQNPSTIQSLPSGGVISDSAYIVGDSVVLPVNEPDITGAHCYGKAYYYLYKLTEGNFPQHAFFKTDNSPIVENIALGYGNPTRLVLSDIPAKDVLVGFGHADQTKDGMTGVNDTFFIRDVLTTGIRSWRILDEVY